MKLRWRAYLIGGLSYRHMIPLQEPGTGYPKATTSITSTNGDYVY